MSLTFGLSQNFKIYHDPVGPLQARELCDIWIVGYEEEVQMRIQACVINRNDAGLS